jgi:hypothetical protein
MGGGPRVRPRTSKARLAKYRQHKGQHKPKMAKGMLNASAAVKHCCLTNVAPHDFDAEQAFRAYKRLMLLDRSCSMQK